MSSSSRYWNETTNRNIIWYRRGSRRSGTADGKISQDSLEVDVVFAAASTKNDYSLAVNIAGPHIPKGTVVRMLQFPMTKDKEETRKAWKTHAETIIAELEQGKNAAFLTLGDPMTVLYLWIHSSEYSEYRPPYLHHDHSRHHVLPGGGSLHQYAAGGGRRMPSGGFRSQRRESSSADDDETGKCRFHEGVIGTSKTSMEPWKVLGFYPMRRGVATAAFRSKNLSGHPGIQ